jgi:hypothetical protein
MMIGVGVSPMFARSAPPRTVLQRWLALSPAALWIPSADDTLASGRVYRNGLDLGAGTYPAVSSPIIGAGGGYLMAGSFLAYCSELIFVPRACTAAELAKFAAYSMGRYGV